MAVADHAILQRMQVAKQYCRPPLQSAPGCSRVHLQYIAIQHAPLLQADPICFVCDGLIQDAVSYI